MGRRGKRIEMRSLGWFVMCMVFLLGVSAKRVDEPRDKVAGQLQKRVETKLFSTSSADMSRNDELESSSLSNSKMSSEALSRMASMERNERHAGNERRLLSDQDSFAEAMVQEQRQWDHRQHSAEKILPQRRVNNEMPKTESKNIVDGSSETNPAHGGIPVSVVLSMTLAMAAAAGVGAVPFFFVRSVSLEWGGIATAIACGVMFAASFDLIHEGQPYGPNLVILGIVLGTFAIKWTQQWLDGMEDVSFGHLKGLKARKMMLMIGIMAAHAVGEGCGVGVSFCGDQGWSQGVLTTLAIGTHNVPEGLAKATVLVGQGASATEALFWSIVTCLPQPLVAIPSFLFVDMFRSLLPVALGFAAGCMIWMVFAELLPDALKVIDGSRVASAATLSAGALEGTRMAFESLNLSGGYSSAANNVAPPTPKSMVPNHITSDGSMGMIITFSTVFRIFLSWIPAVITAAAIGSSMSALRFPPAIILTLGAGFATASSAASVLKLWADGIPFIHVFSATIAGASLAIIVHSKICSFGKNIKNDSKSETLESDIESTLSGKQYQQASTDGLSNIGIRAVECVSISRYDGIFMKQIFSNDNSKYVMDFVLLAVDKHVDTSKGAFFSEIRGMPSSARNAGYLLTLLLLLGSLPLGWQLAREILVESLQKSTVSGRTYDIQVSGIILPFVNLLAIRSAAIGAGIRTFARRSTLSGLTFSSLLSIGTFLSLISYFVRVAKHSSLQDLVSAITYPRSLIDSISATANGAIMMAAFLVFSFAMKIKPRHARTGVLAVAIILGLYGSTLWLFCKVFSISQSCMIF